MARLFVAVEVPAGPKAAVSDVVAPWRAHRSVRWARPETLHLTVKFLGEADEDRIPALVEALSAVAARHRPLEVHLEGFGVFPRRGPARVLWIGVRATDALVALARDVDAACAARGFAPEDRPYAPHLTIGRPRGDARAVIEGLAGTGTLGSFLADALIVFRSDPSPEGATHVPLATCPLGAQIPSA